MLTRLVPRLYAALGAGRWLENPLLERAYLSAFFAYKRFAEDPFAGLVKRHPELFRGGAVLDVGANAGYTAVLFARAIDQGQTVHAFEPEPINVRRLRRVIDARSLRDRVNVVASAVGDRSGEATLVLNPAHPGDHRIGATDAAGSIQVPMISLDDFVERERVPVVSFVKIDVQGYELAVSRGMERLMAMAPRVAVAFEVSEETARAYGYTTSELLAFYTDRGFRLHLLDRGSELLYATTERIAESERRRGYTDILALREPLKR